MVLDLLLFLIIPPIRVVLSVLVVCAGIGIATVTDDKIISNIFGLFVGLAATLVMAMYQIWAGTKQKELQASSTQLLHQYTPQAAVLLGLLIPLMEPIGKLGSHDPNTLLGYRWACAGGRRYWAVQRPSHCWIATARSPVAVDTAADVQAADCDTMLVIGSHSHQP
jgi:solute carrier family 35 protein E3